MRLDSFLLGAARAAALTILLAGAPTITAAGSADNPQEALFQANCAAAHSLAEICPDCRLMPVLTCRTQGPPDRSERELEQHLLATCLKASPAQLAAFSPQRTSTPPVKITVNGRWIIETPPAMENAADLNALRTVVGELPEFGDPCLTPSDDQ